MDRLTEMEAFANVVDQGGFTDAARKMGISKSAVSKHVSSLEARLGARLEVDRGPDAPGVVARRRDRALQRGDPDGRARLLNWSGLHRCFLQLIVLALIGRDLITE